MTKQELEKKLKAVGFVPDNDYYIYGCYDDLTASISTENGVELLEIGTLANFAKMPISLIDEVRFGLEDDGINIMLYAFNKNIVSYISFPIDN